MLFRIALYVIFVAFAAPVEILLDFWAGVQHANPELKWRPLADGLLYLYAFILIIETWFRLQQEDEILRVSSGLKTIQVLCVALIIAFILDYMGAARMRVLLGQSVADSAGRQIAMASLAVACSICSYWIIEKAKAKQGRPV
jgi:hypothetical protein